MFPLVIKALGMAGDDMKKTWFVRLNAVGGEHERAECCREQDSNTKRAAKIRSSPPSPRTKH